MRNYFIIFTMLFFFINHLFSQEEVSDSLFCGLDSSDVINLSDRSDTEIHGGRYITSEGVFKIFIIFAQIQDDQVESTNWPLNEKPSWMEYYVDSDTNHTGNFTHHNISEFFYQMSNGKFQVIGDIYPNVYISKHPESYYNTIKELNEEVLSSIDDSVDFSLYDNWKMIKEYEHSNEPDGVVDMVLILYRSLSRRLAYWSGYAILQLNHDYVTNDNVVIKTGWMGTGYGIQQQKGRYGFSYSMYVSAHELGHYLFGGSHIGVLPNLALMHTNGYAWNAERGMCSWERERLGWINYNDITTNDSINVTLNDYMTTGDVVRINTGYKGEYFLLENRQELNYHDKAKDKGLYIFHVRNGNYSMANIDVECADGLWKFTYDSHLDTLTRDYPIFEGYYDELNFKDGLSGKICIKPHYHENAAWGDDEDAFDLDFKRIFSPWSNPSTKNYGNCNFSVLVTEYNNGVISANVNFSDPLSHPPSKPMNFQVGWKDNHPLLTWAENHEPDFAYYEIYKITSTFYGLYDTTSNTSYVDVVEDSIVNPNFEKPVSYKIRAVDNTDKKSIFTNTLTVAVKMHNPFNNTNSTDSNFLSTQLPENRLYPNYPNPFNPITTIKFSLKNDSYVYLNIYDINGKLVKEIVNGFYKSGVYSVIWDGTNLFGKKVSSGIYFYTLKVNDYFSNNKLILLK